MVSIPWFRGPADPVLRDDTLNAWKRVLSRGQYVGGDEVEAFERDFGAWLGVPAAGVSSGTAALELALRVCGVSSGDEVLLPALTFFAGVESVVRCGARPVIADVDPATGNLDPAACAAALTPRTRAIVPVHLYGRLAEIDAFVALGAERGTAVVEDVAQAHGAARGGRLAGTFGAAGAFSFHPTKNLAACGDAGAVCSPDPAKLERVRRLRNHGQAAHQRHDEFGGTARLDSLQAAALSLRLPLLPGWNAARARLAARYRAELDGCLETTAPAPPGEDVHHLFVVRHPRRDELAAALRAEGIGSAVHYTVPLHLHPAMAESGYAAGDFPVAERWARECLSLPLYPDLGEHEVDRVCAAVRRFCGAAGKV